MYYQIEGYMNMDTITFEEESLSVGDQAYPIDEVEQLRITNAPLFAVYGILAFRAGGRDISVPFPRSAIDKVRRAIHEFEHEQEMRKKNAEKAAQACNSASAFRSQNIPEGKITSADGEQSQPRRHQHVDMDPYEEVKKLKELLDMGILTEEEFQAKKKELLGLP